MKTNRNTPLVSVLLPVFNGQTYLENAIDSILTQTITNFELIIIDDGSTDQTKQLLDRYQRQDSRIKILTNSHNLGMAASLNKGLALCQGQYIARMDADDISLPARFEKQIHLLQSNPNLVAVGCNVDIINNDGQVTGTKSFPTDSQTCYQTLLNYMPVQPPTLMVRGNIFKKLTYDVVLSKNDDINIYFKLLRFGGLSNVPQTLFQYRILSNSVTHHNVKKTYFMAFSNRIDGILHQSYRPNFTNLVLFLIETIIVLILPNYLILKLFDLLRTKRTVPSDIRLPSPYPAQAR